VSTVDGTAILDTLTNNVLNTRFEDLSAENVDNARRRIIDMVGNALGGAALPDMAALANMVEDWDGKEEATILGFGARVPLQEAAMVNCLLGRSFDWGPLVVIVDGKRYPTHTSETTVLTALAAAESRRATGREMITALLVGDDLAARLWVAAGDRPQPGQGPAETAGQPPPRGGGFEPWGTITTFAATAIAGRLLGLSQSQLKQAFGIAVNLISGAGSGLWDGATVFKLSQGSSARSGVMAARLAQAGWTGIEDPFFGRRGGYYSIFENGCNRPEMLTRDLGKTYYHEVVFKPYPGGRPTHAPIQAALALVRQNEVNPDDIVEAVLRTSPPATAAHYAKPYKVGDYPTGDALFSYRFAVASALLRGHAINTDYDESSIRDPRLQALIAKTRQTGLDKPVGVELTVKMKNGREFVEYVPSAHGEPADPLTRDALIDKFMTQVRFSHLVSEEDAADLVALMESLPGVDDVSRIPELAVRRPERRT